MDHFLQHFTKACMQQEVLRKQLAGSFNDNLQKKHIEKSVGFSNEALRKYAQKLRLKPK